MFIKTINNFKPCFTVIQHSNRSTKTPVFKNQLPVLALHSKLFSEDTNTASASLPTSTQEVQPPKSKKPRVLELPSSSTLLPPGLSLDKVNAAVNSLLAPGSATNTLTPTVITSHALVSHPVHYYDCLKRCANM